MLLTYHFHEGEIWRWSNVGIIRAKWEPFWTDRQEAQRIHDEHQKSALIPDYFQRRAVQLTAEMAEAIRQYDEFHSNQQSEGCGKDEENTNDEHEFQEGSAQTSEVAA